MGGGPPARLSDNRAEPVPLLPGMLASDAMQRAADRTLPSPTSEDTYWYQVRRAQAGGDPVVDEYGNPKWIGAQNMGIDPNAQGSRELTTDPSGDPVLSRDSRSDTGPKPFVLPPPIRKIEPRYGPLSTKRRKAI